jgi:predicted nucleic-acid-binding protein
VIGLTTDVLVQFFSQSDSDHGIKARNVMCSLSATEPGWVGVAVLVDLVWEMTHAYKLNRVGVYRILDKLLSSEVIVVEQSEIVRQALNLYRDANTEFADCLISSSAKAAGCSRTVTFDRRAARDAGMELIA